MKKLNDKVTIYKGRHHMIWEGRIVSMTKRTCAVTGKEYIQFGLYVEREFRKPGYAASFLRRTIYASGKEVKKGWWVTEHYGVLVRLMDDYLDIAEPIWDKQRAIVWEKELKDTEVQLIEVSEKRKLAIEKLSPHLRDEYVKVKSHYAGDVIVAVSGGVCTGCYVNIPPNIVGELHAGNSVIRCEQCGRFLYHSDEYD